MSDGVRPEDITEFVRWMVGGEQGRGGRDLTIPREQASAMLSAARRAFDLLRQWKPDNARRVEMLEEAVEAINRAKKPVSVGEAYVSLRISEADADHLRKCVSFLTEFEIVKQADAGRPKRGRR